jgi:hypothetical protein
MRIYQQWRRNAQPGRRRFTFGRWRRWNAGRYAGWNAWRYAGRITGRNAGRFARRNAWNAGEYRHAKHARRFTLDAVLQAESAG